MKIAFLFSGQGSQYPGMAKDIYETYQEARNIYEKASDILKIDVKKLCFEATEEELAKTENAQIAISVTSLAILEVLKKHRIEAQICCGLSLGEYVALMYAGVLSLEDGLTLLQKRGYAMSHFVPKENYAMSAIIGLPSQTIEEVCQNLKKQGQFVTPANYNYSLQTVISGNETAIEIAENNCKELGAKKVVRLHTSGPFHTEKLKKAKEFYAIELAKASFQKPNKIVIKNLDGKPYQEQDNIQEILANHIVSPVRFDKMMTYMKQEKIDTFIEIGPGKSMIGFIKKELKDQPIKCFQTDHLENLQLLLEH